MLEIVGSYIGQHHLLPVEGMVIVAVSGGADSLCLLHLLQRLCGSGKRFPAVSLHVAHFDHQIRGTASAQDAKAVATLAQDWQLPVTLGEANVPLLARQQRRSIEEMARMARYQFLRTLARDLNAVAIAIAHHQDDQVETLLLHWLRGGGLTSMVGIQSRQHNIIRPLLCISRQETLAYCQRHHLTPLEDASNNDTRFLRNRIRHELIPLLTQMNPGYRQTLLRNAEAMQVDLAWIESQIDNCWPQIVNETGATYMQFHLSALRAWPQSLQRHLLRRASAQLSAGQSPLEVRHYQIIEQFLQREDTSAELTLHLPQQLHLKRYADICRLERVSQTTTIPNIQSTVILNVPDDVAVFGTSWLAHASIIPDELLAQVLPALRLSDWATVWQLLSTHPYQVYVDADQLDGDTLQLYVRTRQPGDRIRPLGMTYEKKVQDILVDQHVPRSQRDQIPLFFSGTHCVWLAGIQIDHRVRLRPETRRIVCLSCRLRQQERRKGECKGTPLEPRQGAAAPWNPA
jgi:tRNA(Ile)-lysidine synthase